MSITLKGAPGAVAADAPTGKVAPAPPLTTGAPGATWVTGGAPRYAPRIVLNAVEGWGKSTVGAYAPGAAVIMARGETGYETLLASGRVPDVPRINVHDWSTLLATVTKLSENPGSVQTLVLDALSGIERLCHEHVCQVEYNGDWSDKGFTSFMRGYEVSVREWNRLLSQLDRLHLKGVGVAILSHVQIKQFNNPIGPAYDRFVADCHQKTWSVTHKWADAVLFGTFQQVLVKLDGKTKAKGDAISSRVLYTERSDAYDAKNRYGMPGEIEMPDDYTAAWSTIAATIPFYTQAADAADNKEAK